MRENPDYIIKQNKRYKEFRLNKPDIYGYTYIKSHTKRHNIDFNLSKEEFINIINQPCHYCGGFRPNIKVNGIDRKDNTLGYILSNCLPCCKYCNISKSDRTYEEYIAWIIKSYTHLIPQIPPQSTNT